MSYNTLFYSFFLFYVLVKAKASQAGNKQIEEEGTRGRGKTVFEYD